MIEVIRGRPHPIGDAACHLCCHDEPVTPCEAEGCQGLVHSEVVDEYYDGSDSIWIHEYRCDQCGSTDVPL